MSTSPTSKVTLNRDCFLIIFDILTNQLPRAEETDRPINVVRRASQVCRQWRELLLAESWIWGRLVDLDCRYLPARRKKWLEEVVKRAGSSKLWINGHVRKPYPDDDPDWPQFDREDFFIGLLNGGLTGEGLAPTWERIEKLSVAIFSHDISEVIQRCFSSRAPALEMFEVRLLGIGYEYLFRDVDKPDGSWLTVLSRAKFEGKRTLFGGHAPSLKTIATDQVIPILHYLNEPWLSQICKLTVPALVGMADLHAVLQQTPNLESLVIQPILSAIWGARSMGPLLAACHIANLPRLNNIQLDMCLVDCSRILEYLSTTRVELSVFRINIYASYNLAPYFTDSVKQLTKYLPLYISRYIQFKRANEYKSMIIPSEVFLGLEPRIFAFMDFAGSIVHDHYFADFLIRSSNNRWDKDEEDTVNNCLLGSIIHAATGTSHKDHPSAFRSVKKLALRCRDIRPALHQNLYAMFCVFGHVQSLQTDEDGMDLIWEITSQHVAEGNLTASTQVHGYFPELRVLYLTSITEGRYAGLRQWLTQRKELGFSPMLRLDLSGTNPCGVDFEIINKDFSFLEEFGGLEVVWKSLGVTSESSGEPRYEVCSYACGSGDPEKLRKLPLHLKPPWWPLLPDI